MKNRIAICGYGKVGKSLHLIFPQAEVYDPHLGFRNKDIVNNAEFNFICVPTPSNKNGSCYTSIVEEILSWSKADINIIRSTVSVGFDIGDNNIFMPEYGPSDFKGHPFNKLENVGWAVLGGDVDIAKRVAELLRTALYKLKIFYTDPTTAQMTKLVENAFLYTKVTFFNQIYDLCEKYGINFDEMRLYLTEDPRINEDHTYVYPNRRKVGGHCLPKDMKNLISTFDDAGLDPKFFKMLEDVNETN